MASTDGEIGNELYNALAEITAAARSIRVMSEYLERHPEALIKGKAGNP
jgi:paraquat-inducible protein B